MASRDVGGFYVVGPEDFTRKTFTDEDIEASGEGAQLSRAVDHLIKKHGKADRNKLDEALTDMGEKQIRTEDVIRTEGLAGTEVTNAEESKNLPEEHGKNILGEDGGEPWDWDRVDRIMAENDALLGKLKGLGAKDEVSDVRAKLDAYVTGQETARAEFGDILKALKQGLGDHPGWEDGKLTRTSTASEMARQAAREDARKKGI